MTSIGQPVMPVYIKRGISSYRKNVRFDQLGIMLSVYTQRRAQWKRRMIWRDPASSTQGILSLKQKHAKLQEFVNQIGSVVMPILLADRKFD